MDDTARPDRPPATLITADAPIAVATHGGRAKCLQRLIRIGMPVPTSVALPFDMVHAIATGSWAEARALLAHFPRDAVLCVRPSSEEPDWGGPRSILNIGMNDARHAALADTVGPAAASALYLRFIRAYAVDVARLDPEAFDGIDAAATDAPEAAKTAFAEEAEEPFPQNPATQLIEVLRSMARAWEGTSARILREARGAPPDAGLGLVVQEMATGATEICGSGVIQLVDSDTGLPQVTGRYAPQSWGREALEPDRKSLFLSHDDRGHALQDAQPEAYVQLLQHARRVRARLREEMQLEFGLIAGRLQILDAVRAPRSVRAALRIAVALADDGILSHDEALLRVEPRSLSALLHQQIAPGAPRSVIGRGIGASPGAATGRIVFSAAEAQAANARGEPCILVRRETAPEDVRGMHAAQGVLTERGGMSSHAAVIGRGLGLPCVVGASGLVFQFQRGVIVAPGGQVLRAGDTITLDGSTGEVIAGAPPLIAPAQDDAFQTVMAWADQHIDIAIRANADTPDDAMSARRFNAGGIGLCRTEHMFFDPERLTPMREMIFADGPEDRTSALARLLPMQRADFIELFRIMEGMPVCIRLFDPPLHEFLPGDRAGLRDLAAALDRPVSEVTRRVEAMGEYNPMLGLRGVRLGITVPEIYDMQARAIFEATLEASRDGAPVVPEIMLPLVSARREVELVRARIDAVAAAVRQERGQDFDYRLGVMVETPRACLRAHEIAPHVHFLSFGTNDLTQMTYGLSRDDAGRFMSAYVGAGVFREDPFHVLDPDGVGELLALGAERARKVRPDITLSICGEHGGNPDSIAFCRNIGIGYVSCSPFRVPVARLTAAQLAIRDARRTPAEH